MQGARCGGGLAAGPPGPAGLRATRHSDTPAEAEQLVLYQLGALYGFCRAHGVALQHVKPHGALYNQAAEDPAPARGIARGVARFSRDLPLVALASSRAYAEAAAAAGIPFVAEAFADRRYNPDGTLQSRAVAGSLLTDPTEAAEQVVRLVCEGGCAPTTARWCRSRRRASASTATPRAPRRSSPPPASAWPAPVVVVQMGVFLGHSSG